MKITILTYGSRGDVQPYLALAVGLQRQGHAVQLAAPYRFADFVNSYGVGFVPLAGDPEVISARLNEAGSNPLGMVRSISEYIFSIADQVVQQILAACEDADLIVHSFLFTTGGHSLARKLHVPDISVQTFPVFAPTGYVPPAAMPGLPPGVISTFFHWLIIQVFWHGGNLGFKSLPKAARENFDLDLYWPFKADSVRSLTPLVFAFSPTVIPRPVDWRQGHIHIPGYLFLDRPESYQPPSALTEFLSDGAPPICVTFGSTVHRDPEKVYRSVLDGLSRTGNRAIILSGWSDLGGILMPDNVLVMEAAPHEWLLPQCKAVIHHGGAGTTAAGLRSGIPNFVVPSASDQPFWGARVHAIGAGPRPISARKITAGTLAQALLGLDDNVLRETAQAVGRKIRAEDGVGDLVRLIELHVEDWQASSGWRYFKV
jgi:UDP:flavonoid glycosyltransferase YjiC (YdhE family)